MEFANHNDLDLLIKMEHHGRPVRVADCARFAVRVWTQNQNNFLLFTARDVQSDGRSDRLTIPGYQMAALESGVVVYEYSYSLTDRHFVPFDKHHNHHQDHTKRVVTDIYWKNCNFNQVPSNPVNFQSLNHLRDLIEQEVADRENAIIDLRDYFDKGFLNGLKEEVARATAREDELKALIDENKEIADGCVDALLEKIEAETSRATEAEAEILTKISNQTADTDEKIEENEEKIEETSTALTEEIDRATAAEKQLSDSLTAESDRAKAAEAALTADLTAEVSRAKVKEAELDGKIEAETSRAKIVEDVLADSVDAVRNQANQIAADLAAEVSRSNQKDNDHTAALNDETTRAKASEKAITDRLDVIEGGKETVGSLAHCLEDAKHYVDDLVGKVTSDELKDLTEVNNALNAEISRATTKEAELEASLAVVNGDAETIGSISNAEANAKKYADEAIATTLSNHNTDLTNLTNDLATEVSRAKAAEKTLSDRLDAVQGDKETVGSIAHAVEDAKHYTDDEIAKLNSDSSTAISSVSDSIASEVSRATAKEAEIDSTLAVINGDKEVVGSIAHAAEGAKQYADEQIAKTLSDHNSDLSALTDSLNSEVSRAQASEKALSDRMDAAETILANNTAAITDLAGADTAIANDLATEVSRAQAKEAEIDGVLAVVNGDKETVGSIAHAAEGARQYTDTQLALAKVQNASDLADTLQSYATKDEVDSRVETIIGTAPAALDTLGEIADRLAEDNDAIAAINGVLSGKADKDDVYTKAESEAKHTAITNDLAVASTAITNEVTRAKAAEQTNANAITALDAKVDTVKATAEGAAADLADESNRAKAAEQVNANAITALDTKVDGVKATADKAAADIAALAEEVTGAKSDLSGVSNDLASEVSRATAAEAALDTKIDTAKAAADAAKAVADKAAADLVTESDRAKAAESAIASTISGVSDNVATEVSRATAAEAAIDTKVDAAKAAADGAKAVADKAAADLVDEITRAKTAENTLSTDLATVASDPSTEASRAHTAEGAIEAKADANATEIATLKTRMGDAETALATSASDLTAEVNRAKAAEGDLSNAIAAETSRAQTKEGEIDAALAILNGDAEVIGSVAHAEADSKHYTDDEIAKVQAQITGFASKTEVAAVDARVDNLAARVNEIEAPDTYTKSQIDQKIADVDISDQLSDYAKASETTVIKDEDGNIITEMVIDNSDADDSVEVYTRAQCDEIFAKKGEVSGGADVDHSDYATKAEVEAVQAAIPQIVTLTQAQYDALEEKAANTLYIVNG